APDIDAHKVLELTRAAAEDLPVIAVAAGLDPAACAAMVRAGMRDVLAEADLARLLAVVEREIETCRLHRRITREAGRDERHFRNIVETSLQGIMVRANGETKFVHPAFCRMFGYTAEEMMRLKSSIHLHH